MKTSLLLLALLVLPAIAADVEIGSTQFPYNAPLCAT